MENKIDPESHWERNSSESNRKPIKYIKFACFLILLTLVVFCLKLTILCHVEHSSTTNTDLTVPFAGTDLSTNTLSDEQLSKRLSDGWKVALGAAGTVGFGLLAAGFFVGPLTLAVGLWADYIAGSVLSSAAAGIGAYGAFNGWHWGGPGGTDGKRDTYLPGRNWEMDEEGRRYHLALPHIRFDDFHPSIDDHLMGLFESYGIDQTQIVIASFLEMDDKQTVGNNTDTAKRDGVSTVDTYSFVYNHTGSLLISVMVPVETASEAIGALAEYVKGDGRLTKRSDSTWVSFTSYGENDNVMNDVISHQEPYGDGFEDSFKDWFGEQLQPCDFVQCWGGASKGCAAMSEDRNRGENSGIVGEFYTSAFGGIDNECQSG